MPCHAVFHKKRSRGGQDVHLRMGEMNLYTRPIREDTLPSDGQMQQEPPADQIAATAQRPQYPLDFLPESTLYGLKPSDRYCRGWRSCEMNLPLVAYETK